MWQLNLPHFFVDIILFITIEEIMNYKKYIAIKVSSYLNLSIEKLKIQ